MQDSALSVQGEVLIKTVSISQLEKKKEKGYYKQNSQT